MPFNELSVENLAQGVSRESGVEEEAESVHRSIEGEGQY